MGKPQQPRRLAETEALAEATQLRTSPRKLNLVAASIRGMKVETALAELTFSKRRIAKDVKKVLQSAIANAENNMELIAEELKVGQVAVDEGPTIKRYRPRALGRATRINKRTSHLSIVLTAAEEG